MKRWNLLIWYILVLRLRKQLHVLNAICISSIDGLEVLFTDSTMIDMNSKYEYEYETMPWW